MRCPRLRDTDGAEYDPETGMRLAPNEAPPDETQSALPVADETEDGGGRIEEFAATPGWLLRDAVLASEQVDKWMTIWRRR